MSDKNLIAALQQIRAIVDETLGTARTAKPARTKSPRVKTADAPMGLPQHILKLRDAGFFREPRTAAEVHAKLQASYHCAADRVVMALLRLKNARNLRKTSKTVGKKKLIAYVW